MEGITILNIIERGGFSIEILFLIIFLFIFPSIFLLIIIIYGIKKQELSLCGIASIFFLIFIIIIFSLIPQINTPKYNEYQIIISDDVNFKDFNKKYEIIKQDGEIYTVIEK